MAKGILDLLVDIILNSARVGKIGEKLTVRKLKVVQLFGRKGKVLTNIYLPKDNGETSEVDVVFISQKGIFVFESKNYSGWIFGDKWSKNWTATFPNGERYHFFNPIIQNKTHLKWMRSYVGDDVPLFSIIVFSERCTLKKITVNSDDVIVIQRNETYGAVKEIWDNNPDVLSEDRIEELYAKLEVLTNVDEVTKAAHIENIEQKYKVPQMPVELEGSEPEEDVQDTNEEETSEEMICPECGSKLVLRVAKKGANAGKSFYGCSAFPRCKYTQDAR